MFGRLAPVGSVTPVGLTPSISPSHFFRARDIGSGRSGLSTVRHAR